LAEFVLPGEVVVGETAKNNRDNNMESGAPSDLNGIVRICIKCLVMNLSCDSLLVASFARVAKLSGLFDIKKFFLSRMAALPD